MRGIEEVIFTGSVVFISNLPMSKLPQPLLSRSLTVDLHMTLEETIERLDYILPHMESSLSDDKKKECLNLLNQYKEVTRDVNARTLLKLFAIREGMDSELWKDLAVYSLIN